MQILDKFSFLGRFSPLTLGVKAKIHILERGMLQTIIERKYPYSMQIEEMIL